MLITKTQKPRHAIHVRFCRLPGCKPLLDKIAFFSGAQQIPLQIDVSVHAVPNVPANLFNPRTMMLVCMRLLWPYVIAARALISNSAYRLWLQQRHVPFPM